MAEAKPDSVHIFMNGMVAVFDFHGQQISDLQGPWNKKKAAIFAACDENTKFHLSRWAHGEIEIRQSDARRITIDVAGES